MIENSLTFYMCYIYPTFVYVLCQPAWQGSDSSPLCPQNIVLQRLIVIARLPHDLTDRTELGGQPAITFELQILSLIRFDTNLIQVSSIMELKKDEIHVNVTKAPQHVNGSAGLFWRNSLTNIRTESPQ